MTDLGLLMKEKDFNEIEEQYRKLIYTDWTNNASSEGIPEDTVRFWGIVKTYQDAIDNKTFDKLATHALSACIKK